MNDNDPDENPLERLRYDRAEPGATPSLATEAVSALEEPLIALSDDDSAALPHWTEPPTGKVPVISADGSFDIVDDLAVARPVWRDEHTGQLSATDLDFSDLGVGVRSSAADSLDEPRFSDEQLFVAEPIPSGFGAAPEVESSVPVMPIRPGRQGPPRAPIGKSPRADATRRPSSSIPRAGNSPKVDGRNMPVAIAVGVALLAVLAGLAMLGPRYLLGLVVVVLGIAAGEFFDAVRRAGYQPAQLLGIVAVVALPPAAYWRGPAALPVVLFVSLIGLMVVFLTSGGLESNPAPNIAITLLGIVYIGFLGSYAALILRGFENPAVANNGVGTLWAIVIGIVGYDVGGLVFGSSVGRSKLVEWVSPNKTWEGLIGGMLVSFLAIFACYLLKLHPWDVKAVHAVQLGLVVAIAAPLGDLGESMLKRNLGVKDFGSILPGHGGALDRFDAFLFVLPAVYYLTRVLNIY